MTNSRYPLRPLGEVIYLDRDEVPVESTTSYRLAGMYSFGRGVLEREPLSGSEMSYRSLFRLHEGDLVMSRLNGWEGALAVVTEAHDGCFVSNEYPTFSVDQSQALPSYLALLCRWPRLWEALRERARGLGSDVGARRLRVHPEQLLAIGVPLPDIEEQRRITTRLNAILQPVHTIAAHSREAMSLHGALVDRSVEQLLRSLVDAGWEEQPLGSIAEVNPKPLSHPITDEVAFVPMSAVDEFVGAIKQVELRLSDEVSKGYRQFCLGDVIFARITPCMQNGKAAVVRALPTKIAYGSTEFHVLRPLHGVSADWIHRIIRTQRFRDDAAAHFKGTAGQQRVPASFLEDVRVPVPSSSEDERRALDRIDRLLEMRDRLRALGERSTVLTEGCQLAVLNAAFAGLM